MRSMLPRSRSLLASAALLAMSGAAAALPVERFVESAGASGDGAVKTLPPGHPGFEQLTEAVTTEYGALLELVRQALREKVRGVSGMADYYVDVQGIFPDRVVARLGGRLYAWPYTLQADNTVQLGEMAEVVASFQPVREAAPAGAPGAWLREAADGSGAIEVTLIRGGLSRNGNYYPDAALKAAVPLFEGVRVFAKSDAEHIKGGGKDVRGLLGGVYGVRFVEGTGTDAGALVGTFKPIDPQDGVVRKMVEAVKRGLQGLMGLSIDASARTKREQRGGKTVRVAERFVRVDSVDLIVEPGAGGGLDRLAEAASADADPSAATPSPLTTNGASMFKKRLLAALAALNAQRAAALQANAATTDDEITAALREAAQAAGADVAAIIAATVAAADEAAIAPAVQRLVEAAKAPGGGNGGSGNGADDEPVTRAELQMLRLREASTRRIHATNLPAFVKDRLQATLDARERFTEADVDQLIKTEREYIARFTESGTVRMGDGARVTVEDRSLAIRDMLDAFFDPQHKDHRRVQSFKECYIEITGDRRVTGRLSDCDLPRLRESVGAIEGFQEAVASSTFSNVLGDSITRRLMQVYGQMTDLQVWRRLVNVVPVQDFRSQERVQLGGYGNLPTVAQAAGYTVMTSPGDLKATYTVTKRGGLETVTLEAIKNDDVRALRRIPDEMAMAAANTLYEFVMDFFRTNPITYDTAALYTAPKGNLFTAALSAAEYAAHRLAMSKQARLSSAKRRGVTPGFLLVPVDLQEIAFNIFQRNQNNDPLFVATVQPTTIVVPYWTDTNDWCTVARPQDLPVLEIGFLDGREDPEVFVQDMPNVGSLFSNDQLTYKIRHIYGGTVVPEGEKGTTKAVVP